LETRKVYSASDPVNAEIVKDYLRAHGIAARVQEQYLWGGMGQLPADVYPSIWLDDPADYARARELVQEFESGGARRPDWRCPRCREHLPGQFEICWQCGAARRDNV